jgi:RNA methyltransferase, TrmH family
MATRVGGRAERLVAVRALRSVKGRRAQHRFAFEGETLLTEADACRFPLLELYVTQHAYDGSALVRRLDHDGVATFILEAGAAARISDVVAPSGILAVGPLRVETARQVFERRGTALILADAGDPANAGTLLRSADAFGCGSVIFGRLGVDPYNPKVVRGSMGAIFRLQLAVADPADVAEAAAMTGARLLGLDAAGSPLTEANLKAPIALVVGHERHGLARWRGLCEALVSIPIAARSESLSAAVAGSIALYEASRFRVTNQRPSAGLETSV